MTTVNATQERRRDAIRKMEKHLDRLNHDKAIASQRADEWMRRVQESKRRFFEDYEEKA